MDVEVTETEVAALDAAFDRWNRATQRYESARRLFISETMTRILLEHAKGIVEREWQDTQASQTLGGSCCDATESGPYSFQ